MTPQAIANIVLAYTLHGQTLNSADAEIYSQYMALLYPNLYTATGPFRVAIAREDALAARELWRAAMTGRMTGPGFEAESVPAALLDGFGTGLVDGIDDLTSVIPATGKFLNSTTLTVLAVAALAVVGLLIFKEYKK